MGIYKNYKIGEETTESIASFANTATTLFINKFIKSKVSELSKYYTVHTGVLKSLVQAYPGMRKILQTYGEEGINYSYVITGLFAIDGINSQAELSDWIKIHEGLTGSQSLAILAMKAYLTKQKSKVDIDSLMNMLING